MNVFTAYRRVLERLGTGLELESTTDAHYSGSFGFQSLSIQTFSKNSDADPRQRASVEAHEALHAVQAFSLGSVREVFRAFQSIARFRFFHLNLLVERTVRIKPGQTIFEVYARESFKDSQTGERLILDACDTINAALDIRHGVSVMGLIEGAAYAVEVMHLGDDLTSKLDEAPPLYRQAWALYREAGGSNIKVFAQLCSASLRYGSVDPTFADHYPHPTEVYSYLLHFVSWFESHFTTIPCEEPDYASVIPPGEYDEFGPIKAGKPPEFLDDIPEITSRNHFFPDDMFESDVEDAIESYKAKTHEQRQMQDAMFGVSMAIASAIDSAYIRVADTPGSDSANGRKLFDLIHGFVFKSLPGLHIEEVFIHSLVNQEFQQRVVKVFKEDVAGLSVRPWDGEEKEVPHKDLMRLISIAERVDFLSLAEGYRRDRDIENWRHYAPKCCSQHDDLRDLQQITECENIGSINRDFGEMTGVDLADFMRG